MNRAPPRATPQEVEAMIASEHYFTAADGVCGAGAQRLYDGPLATLTFCVLLLHNGHTAFGKAFCTDPAKWDEASGRARARADALGGLYPFILYARRDRAHHHSQQGEPA
jgi:hypothetical protein